MQNFLYEAKPLIMIFVAVLAIIQIDDQSSVFEVSGYILLAAAVWILFARFKHRGLIGKKESAD